MARRARRGGAKRAREAQQTLSAGLKIAGVAVAVVAVGGIYAVLSSRPKLDKATLCPPDPTSVTVLLVDVTDPMNPAQRQDFMNQLEGLKNAIPRHGKLAVVKVDAASETLLKPIIEKCNPGTARDANAATGNPEKLQHLWDEEFSKPLDAVFSSLAIASAADQSPILESVQSVALTQFQAPGVVGKPRTLIVASDLLQNTPAASFYGQLPEAKTFMASEAFRKARTDLRGVDVELWMLQRADATGNQTAALPQLWAELFAAQGGAVRRAYNVSG